MMSVLRSVVCHSGSARKAGSSKTDSASGIFLCLFLFFVLGCVVLCERQRASDDGFCFVAPKRPRAPTPPSSRSLGRVVSHLHDVVHEAHDARQHLRRRLFLLGVVAGELWVAVEQADERRAQQQVAQQLQARPRQAFVFVGVVCGKCVEQELLAVGCWGERWPPLPNGARPRLSSLDRPASRAPSSPAVFAVSMVAGLLAHSAQPCAAAAPIMLWGFVALY